MGPRLPYASSGIYTSEDLRTWTNDGSTRLALRLACPDISFAFHDIAPSSSLLFRAL